MFFSRRFFFSQCRKHQQRNISVLCFRKFLVAKLFMDKKGEYQEFPSKIFCLTVPKNFVAESFSVSLTSGIQKIYATEGYLTIFCRKCFVSQCRKISRGSLLCCVSENFRQQKSFQIGKRGKYQVFPSKFFFVSQFRKMPQGFPLVFE